MINEDYHKGEHCIFSAVMCQEGFCSGCMIFLNRVTELEQSVDAKKETHWDYTYEKDRKEVITG